MNCFHRCWNAMPLLLTAYFVVILGAVAAQGQAAPKITDIIVVGNKNINREAIVASSGLKIGDPLTQAALDNAQRSLVNMGTFGYGSDTPEEAVKVRAELTGESAKVVIEVQENEVINSIDITGSGPVSTAEIVNLMQSKVGRVFNLNTLKSDIDRIQHQYTTLGYQAAVTEQLDFHSGKLTLPIAVLKVSKIDVVGLKKTLKVVVTREMKLKEGSYYNEAQLKKDITAIWNTDLFSDINPNFKFPAGNGKVEIVLNMQEKRTGTAGVGLGYSSAQKLVGRIELSENNLMGRGQQASLLWETGGIANRNSFELNFTEPWVDKRHTTATISLFDKTVYRFGTSITSDTLSTSNDYYETHKGGQITVSRPFGEAFRAYVGVRYDNVQVPSLTLSTNDLAILQNGPLADINLKITHNSRDFDQDPASGGYEILSGDLGRADLKPVTAADGTTATGVAGVMNYTKLTLDARRYISPQGRRNSPKDKRSVFAFRLMFGLSTGTLPFSEQYFIGGAESLRGYAEDRFWGNNMFLGSVEYRAPLANSLTGVLFTDVGDAWGGRYEDVTFNSFTQHSGFSPSVGIGLGLRVVTPIGPIRIDEGFGREGARTHFSIGHQF